MSARAIILALAACAAIGIAFEAGRIDGLGERPAPPAALHPKAPAAPKAAVPAATATHAELPEVDTGPDITSIASYEDLMYAQPDLVDAQVKALHPQTPGKVDLYVLGFAGDAQQNAFRNEVEYLPRLLAGRFAAEGHTVQLVNSQQTFERTPLAMRSNLYDALAGIGDTMDRNEDILLLFLTSHGSRDHELLVDMGSLPLDQLTPRDIRDALDKARITWRVIVVSACFSGGFIPELQEPHTLIITAARSDRTSFGCGADSKITWFGEAFLTQALNRTSDFHEAFVLAGKTIAFWEHRDGQTPSEPQFWEGPLIAPKLAAWRATLPAAALTVPFAPAMTASAAHRAAR